MNDNEQPDRNKPIAMMTYGELLDGLTPLMPSVAKARPRLVNKKQLAEIVNLSIPIINRQLEMGAPSLPIAGTTKVMFNPDHYLAWLERNQERAVNGES